MSTNETSTFLPGSNIGLLSAGSVTIAVGHAAGARIVKRVNVFNPTGNGTITVALQHVLNTTAVTLREWALAAGATEVDAEGAIVLDGTNALQLVIVSGSPVSPIEWAIYSAIVAVPNQ